MVLNVVIILSMALSLIQLQPVYAQSGDGLKRQVNSVSGRVSFIGPESGRTLSMSEALGISSRPQDPAMALARHYGPEFGIKNPDRELAQVKKETGANGRITARYQQMHEGIPVMGGELIVNTNENGDLYSINGEIAPDLTLATQPMIESEQARQNALNAMAKWYETSPESFVASEPELWIYDESLLQTSTRPVELVWRMDVTAKDSGLPVRELVLINAQRGGTSLHFNQIDAAWDAAGRVDAKRITTSLPAERSRAHSGNEVSGIWYVATTGDDVNSCSVPAEPCQTINAAIGKAQAEDTIKVAIGSYLNYSPEGVSINKSITLSGGWDADFFTQPGRSTIDGMGSNRGVTVTAGTVFLDRFIIQKGYHYTQGGGVYNGQPANLTLSNSIVTDNVSDWMGGGIYSVGLLTIVDTTITLNSAGFPTNGGGGGGAGIESASGSLILNNSTVSYNKILGAFNDSGIGVTGGAATINNSTISGNTGSQGIGVSTWHDTVNINNSTITENPSGGLMLTSGTVSLQNTLIAKNGAWGDCSASIYYGGITISGGHNLMGRNADCSITAVSGDLIGTSDHPINPWLNPLADNGGSTLTHALSSYSPAVDAGDPATCLSTDQRGVARPVGERCDIGAYEGSETWIPAPPVQTYTLKNNPDTALPGTFLCDQTDPNCAAGDAQARAAHKFALGIYDLYANRHLRNSLDNNGMVIVSTVHYCKQGYACPYANAYWNGEQMVYGDKYGFALADDIVAHELTHGVTQYSSGLFYYYQSGAINESFSDLWGEYYDQVGNITSGDTASVKWLLGEDTSGLGAVRSMSNPPAYGDPDKMTSTLYYKTKGDNGGVHHNGGINNKVVYLLVDGGTFNGKTVTALGWSKTAAIYYEAQTNLLTSGADYSDLYYALQQACTNLTGKNGILAANCTQVKNAVDAVQMNSQPVSGFNAEAALCPTAGTVPNIAFADDMETGSAKWTFNNGVYTRWQYDSPYGPYAQSGLHSIYADDYPDVITDVSATLTGTVIPANAYLHFAQAYGFEYDTSGYYDGGVLEYSTNGGSTWTDAGSLMQANGYDAKIYANWNNPLKGRSAFVGSSHGYISTRLSLATLAGKTVKFRWRMALDSVGYDWGWWVDNVKIYTCVTGRTISGNVGGPGVRLSYSDAGMSKSVMSQANGNYSISVPNGWSGMVIPSFACTTFAPSDRDYSNVTANQTGQNYTPTSEECANVDVSIGGVAQGSYYAHHQETLVKSYAGLQNGPVKVKSPDNSTLFASERVISGNSFNEVMGYPTDQLTTEYWFPWYDNIDMATWVLVGNASSFQSATVDIYIGGVKRTTQTIPPNGRVTPRFSLQTGPVRVVSTNGVKIFTSERTVYKGSFNEVMGYPASQFTTEYWFPWYDNSSMLTWILVGNPSTTSTAAVDIYVGGVKRGSYAIPKGGRITPRFNITPSGPVRVVCSNCTSTNGVKIFSSERTIYGDSFNEVMGSPANQFTTEYWYPWYNNVNMATWVLVANPTSSTANVDIYIGGVKRGSYSIGAGKQVNQRFPLNTGPVRVVSTNGVKIFSSERVLYSTSFNEVMGYLGNQLATEYWFPWYDSTSMSTDILVGRP
jgi:Zn-dependent metalloprotease